MERRPPPDMDVGLSQDTEHRYRLRLPAIDMPVDCPGDSIQCLAFLAAAAPVLLWYYGFLVHKGPIAKEEALHRAMTGTGNEKENRRLLI